MGRFVRGRVCFSSCIPSSSSVEVSIVHMEGANCRNASVAKWFGIIDCARMLSIHSACHFPSWLNGSSPPSIRAHFRHDVSRWFLQNHKKRKSQLGNLFVMMLHVQMPDGLSTV